MNYIKPDWPAPAQIKAYTTTRKGWGGRIFVRGEMEGKQDTDQLISLLRLPAEPVWLKQVHDTTVVTAEPGIAELTADASHTSEPGRVCVISTADCLPVLVCNKQGTRVAAMHAGWRGLSGGIIENTIEALALPPDDLLVWLGPAIGPQKFEVGRDVYDAFTSRHAESASAFTVHRENKWLADLYALARIRLRLLGINAVYGGGYCTYTQEELFFSYRRDHGNTGRMASLIWIDV